MWTILESPSHPLPTLMKRSDLNFPMMIRNEYSVVYENFKWICEQEMERRTALICETLI